MIISIDESNFRVDAFKRRKWTFVPDNRSVCNLMSSTALDTESQLPPIDQALLPAPIVSSSPAAVEEGNVESELLTRSRSLIKGCSKRTKQARASSKSNSNQLEVKPPTSLRVTKPQAAVEELKEPLPIVHQSKLK